MTSGAGATFTYDEANRIATAEEGSGAIEYYTYAPDNKRIYKLKSDGTEEWTFYGIRGEKLGVFQWNASSGLVPIRSNVSFAGRLIVDNNYPVFQDRLGTNRASGARFYPYGDEITSTSNDREKFATYTRDGYTGLDYADQRFYASTYGRLNTPDPYVASDSSPSDPSTPQSWNRYAYVLGDPVNAYDPKGLDTTYTWNPPSLPTESTISCSAVLDPLTGLLECAGSVLGSSQAGTGAQVGTKFPIAQGYFQMLAKSLSKKKYSQKCNTDFAAVGTSANAIAAGAASAVFLNGVNSSVPLSSLYANSPVPGVAQAGSALTGTVGSVIAAPGTVAVAQLGGSNIYLNSAQVNTGPNAFYQDISVLLHELLHNVTGLTDSDIQKDLGLQESNITDNITQKLLKDCF